jgi:hypothetical protein
MDFAERSKGKRKTSTIKSNMMKYPGMDMYVVVDLIRMAILC